MQLIGARRSILRKPAVNLGGMGVPAWLGAADVGIGTNGTQLVAFSAGKSVPVASLLSVSRAQTVSSYAENADVTLTAFAANTLRWGVGTGVLIEEARTNLALQSGDISTTAWPTFIQGSGTITKTGAAGLAPDGTNSATLLSLNRSSTADTAQIYQVFTSTAATYSCSLYVKAATNADIGQSIVVGLFDASAGAVHSTTAILTGSWQRVTQTATMGASASSQIYAGYINENDGTRAVPVSFYAWGGQVELGSGATSYIPTTTSSVTRNADTVTATGDLLTAYKAAAVTQFTRVMNMTSAATSIRLGASFNGATGSAPAAIVSDTGVNGYNGTSTVPTATIGNAIDFLSGSPINIVASYSASGMSVVADGGTETTSALVMPAVTSATIGSYQGTLFLNGYLNRLLVFKSQLASAARIALSATFNITSLTIGGQLTRYLVPTEARSGTYVIYFHGSGEVETAWTASPLLPNTREALLAQGHILSDNAAEGDNWGNQASLNDYQAQYTDAIARYSISKTVFLSQSMGGPPGLLSIAAGSIPMRGWYGIYPVCNLANMFAGNTGSFAAPIRAAYGLLADGSDYATKTAGHDPVLLSGGLFTIPMRFTASDGDTVVNKAANETQMQTLVAAHAAESFMLNTIGDHGDLSNFIPYDVVNFFARC